MDKKNTIPDIPIPGLYYNIDGLDDDKHLLDVKIIRLYIDGEGFIAAQDEDGNDYRIGQYRFRTAGKR